MDYERSEVHARPEFGRRFQTLDFEFDAAAAAVAGRTLLVQAKERQSAHTPVYLAQSAFHLRKWTDGKAILVHCLYLKPPSI